MYLQKHTDTVVEWSVVMSRELGCSRASLAPYLETVTVSLSSVLP